MDASRCASGHGILGSPSCTWKVAQLELVELRLNAGTFTLRGCSTKPTHAGRFVLVMTKEVAAASAFDKRTLLMRADFCRQVSRKLQHP